MPRRIALLLLALFTAAATAGCGATSNSGGQHDATLLLDFTPNAVHAGIYMALARDYDGAEGVALRVRAPSASTDALRLLRAGRVDFALLDISDLAIARERGAEITGVMAIVQQPLAAILARPGVRRPRDLEGRRVGVAGLPSDLAVLDSIVRSDGGDPAKVRRTTIGFNAVPALLAGRVAGATAFWNVEGVALEQRLPGAREFRVDDFGAPAYPELVLCTTGTTVQDQPQLVQGVVNALRRGYDEVLQDPPSGVETLLSRAKGLDRKQVTDELDAVDSAFVAGDHPFGWLDRGRLVAWARWAKRFGLVRRTPDVDRLFVPRFANRG